MIQALFIGALYFLGVVLGLLLRKHLPFALIAITGVLWGAALWTAAAMVCLATPLPFTLASMAALLALVLAVLIGAHIRQHTWALTRRELLIILGMAGVLIAVVLITSQVNYATATPDSMNQVLFARVLAHHGITDWATTQFSNQGVVFVSLQAASVFLGDAYLWSLQPVFGVVFILTFTYMSLIALAGREMARGRAWAWAIITVFTLMIGTFFMRFQMAYLHTNFPSSVYLFVAVAAFWIALRDHNHAWIAAGMVALTVFSLLRTEAPLYSLIFLSVLIANEQLSYRERLAVALPYSLIVGLWFVFLLNTSTNTHILTSDRILLVIGAMTAFGGGTALTGIRTIERRILPLLPVLMLIALLVLLGVTYLHGPTELKHAIRTTANNMLFAQWWHATWASNWWGATWLSMIILAGGTVLLPRIPNAKLFTIGIPAFFVLLFDFILVRSAYRSGWGDSGNRMLVHILPVIFLALQVTYYQGLDATDDYTARFIQGRRAYVLAAVSGVVIVLLLRYVETLI